MPQQSVYKTQKVHDDKTSHSCSIRQFCEGENTLGLPQGLAESAASVMAGVKLPHVAKKTDYLIANSKGEQDHFEMHTIFNTIVNRFQDEIVQIDHYSSRIEYANRLRDCLKRVYSSGIDDRL